MSRNRRQHKSSPRHDDTPLDDEIDSDSEPTEFTVEEQQFDGYFASLAEILKTVETERHLKSKTVVVVKKALAEYLRYYARSSPSIHMEKFEDVYLEHRPEILKDYDEVEWLVLRDSPLLISHKPKAFINLTVCYRDALFLKDNDTTDKWTSYPDAILLQLYKIFTLVCPRSDESKLNRIIASLQKSVDSSPIEITKAVPSSSSSSSSSGGSADGPPDPSKILADLQSGNFDLSGILSNPAVKGILGPMLGSLDTMMKSGNIKTPGDAFRQLGDVFENPEIAKVLQEGLPATAKMAVDEVASVESTSPKTQ